MWNDALRVAKEYIPSKVSLVYTLKYYLIS